MIVFKDFGGKTYAYYSVFRSSVVIASNLPLYAGFGCSLNKCNMRLLCKDCPNCMFI